MEDWWVSEEGKVVFVGKNVSFLVKASDVLVSDNGGIDERERAL